MDNQKKNVLKKSLIVITQSFLILAAILSTFAPFIIDTPENILRRVGSWQTTKATTATAWEATDGSTAQYVSEQTTDGGIQIILSPTQTSTREAFFATGLSSKRSFILSVNVNTPRDCHNGLVFRGNAQGEYYLFLVSQSSYTVEILRRESNNDLPREAIIPNTAVSDAIIKPVSLTILGNGKEYFFYINNILVNHMNDGRLSGNRVGVEVFT